MAKKSTAKASPTKKPARRKAAAKPDAAVLLARIAAALERLAPSGPPAPDFDAADAFVWRADSSVLAPVPKVNRVDIDLLRGIDFGPGGVPRQYNYGVLTSDPFQVEGDWKSTNTDFNASLDGKMNHQSAFTRASYDLTDDLNVFVQGQWG